ncbi:MAG TPA: hypothetical protein VE439_08210 [Anaerolineae bacterium]|nr:hypothetical protein [Anaerolineae bacterium]
MVKRHTTTRQILQYVAGIGTEVLFTAFLIVVALAVSILALRWF